MRAILVESGELVEREIDDPFPGRGEVLISVAAAGVNRADVSQRLGRYPSPPGAPTWPGLEVSGTIAALGDDVTRWSIGDRVCALLSGGGYASLAVVSERLLLPVPQNIPLVDAAGLPETVATVWSNLVLTADLRAGETLLVHGGSSGIGVTAIQLGRALGCTVAVTAGSARKLAACERLGADILIDYTAEDFVAGVLEATDGRGADVILDPIGGDYLARDVAALAAHGRIVLIGTQRGSATGFEIGDLMRRWGSIYATTLRARSADDKAAIVASVRENVWPMIEAGQIVPIIDSRMPLADAARAHERMEASEHIGKILLTL